MGTPLSAGQSARALAAATTPTKQLSADQYGSPISGLCTSTAPAAALSTSARGKLHMVTAGDSPRLASSSLGRTAYFPAGAAAAGEPNLSGQQQAGSGMPQQLGSAAMQHQAQQLRLSADSRLRRDQDWGQPSPRPSPRSSCSMSAPARALQQRTPNGSPAGSSGASVTQGPLAQQALLPLDVLLSPLLPSADEARLVDRLSQLRHALDEHVRLAAGWEQQAVTLQQALSEAQDEALLLRGQAASQQQHIKLLGGNLQGRLALVQGAVLAEMQQQVAQKDTALAAGAQHVHAIQSQLEQLSCSYVAKLAAEQAERQRLSAEAAQARLLCTARGRQVASLQQELQQMQAAAEQQQQAAAESSSMHQQQLEAWQQQLLEAQREAALARQQAAEAQQAIAGAQDGSSGLQLQVGELHAQLSEKQLQVEWLEGRVADLETGDVSQQLQRHQAEVARLQEAAAEDRRALEQQLASTQRQAAQSQQQLHELEQQVQDLQQQLEQQQAVSDSLGQQLQQQQHYQAAEPEVSQQLAGALAEVQQLQEQLSEAEEERAALNQHVQQQEEQQAQLQQHLQQMRELHAQQGYGAAAASGEAAEGLELTADGGSPHAPAAAVHALRAELGVANAEIARLRHQLDVAQASQQQERELTGHEILRLQQELSDAVEASESCGGAAAADGGVGEEVTSRRGTNHAGSDSSSSSWHSVHDNPAFEHGQPAGHQVPPGAAAVTGDWQQHQQPAARVHGHVLPPGEAAAEQAAAASILHRYEEKLQDQADTISSLQRQLKQQEQLLAALQKRERRVFDSAASKSSWAEALGFEGARQHSQQPWAANGQAPAPAAALSAAAADEGFVLQSFRVYADVAVQTDLSGPAESAGSTAAAPAATESAQQAQEDQQASSRRQQVPGARAGDSAASSALLAVARHEILRLQELNRQLMQAHAEELKASVGFEDARRAVSEAKQHTKAKAAAALQASNKTWSDRLAAARAEVQLLQGQLRELQQQRDQLAAQLSTASEAHQSAVQQLQQELSEVQQHSASLTRQLQDMSDSHLQELEQVRMEAEADAAAAMLDAAAATNKLQQQQQQRQQQHAAVCEAAMQTEASEPAGGVEGSRDAESQTEEAAAVEVQQGICVAAGQSTSQQQQQAEEASKAQAGASNNHCMQVQRCAQQHELAAAAAHADDRPCTPQPAAPAAAPAAAGAAAAAVSDGAAAAMDPAQPAANAPQQQHLAPSWHAPAAAARVSAPAGAGDLADDDICRFSSASDTPATVNSKVTISRVSGGLQRAAAAGAGEGQRPHSAGAVSLPELTASSSPIAPSSAYPAARQGLRRPAHQQQQQLSEPNALTEPQLRQQHGPPYEQHQQQQQAGAEPVQARTWHEELLQQQAELEALRARLSQQQQPWKAAPPAVSCKGSPAVAASRTLLLAPFGPTTGALRGAAAAGGGGSAGGVLGGVIGVASPAGPLLSSSSPLTYQQRRAAAQQAAAAPDSSRLLPGSTLTPNSSSIKTRPPDQLGLAAQARQLYPQQSVETAAVQLTQHEQQLGGQRATAAAGMAGDAKCSFWHSCSSGGSGGAGLSNSTGLLLGSPRPYGGGAVGIASVTGGVAATGGPGSAAAAGASSSSWGLSLTAAAAAGRNLGRSVSPAVVGRTDVAGAGLLNHTSVTPSAVSPRPSAASSPAATAPAGPATASTPAGADVAVTPAGAAVGLAQLGDDMLGALSLSRYHRERSKLQEARARQHALLATQHADRAAALRTSRLASPTALVGASGPAAAAEPQLVTAATVAATAAGTAAAVAVAAPGSALSPHAAAGGSSGYYA